MQTSRKWLSDLLGRVKDSKWLTEQTENLYTEIDEGLRRERDFTGFIEGLIALEEHIKARCVIADWIPLVIRALSRTSVKQTTKRYLTLTSILGSLYMRVGLITDAHNTYETLVVLADEYHYPVQYVEGYIGLLHLCAYRSTQHVDQEVVSYLLALATTTIGNGVLNSRLLQAVAYYNMHSDQPELPVRCAEMAFYQLQSTDKNVLIGSAAYALSCAYRQRNDVENTRNTLEIAISYYAKTDYKRQYAAIAHQIALMEFDSENFVTAEQWFRIALAEYYLIQDEANITSCLHGLGMTLSYIDGKLSEARHLLNEVLIAWKQYNNMRFVANVQHTLAFVEARLGEKEAALDRLNDVLGLCFEQSVEDLEEEIAARVLILIHQIKDGADLSLIRPAKRLSR